MALTNQDKAKLVSGMAKDASDKVAITDSNRGIFGMDPVTDKDTPLAKGILGILKDEINTEVIDIVRGRRAQPRKAATVWERHMPEELSPATQRAVDYIRKNDDFTWEHFLGFPEVEKALAEDVVYKLLAELAETRSFINHERELVADWEKQSGGGGYYDIAKNQVDDYIKMVFPPDELRNKENEDGIAAFRLVRMAAYRYQIGRA